MSGTTRPQTEWRVVEKQGILLQRLPRTVPRDILFPADVLTVVARGPTRALVGSPLPASDAKRANEAVLRLPSSAPVAPARRTAL